ncbi:MAG: PD40 domain-containing protein [Anaerolineae bacterium]|nr:PD40 domain-containing protein [Anaerolineae bacterium]
MLVRAFRVTDRLGNAGLRLGAWAVVVLAEQTSAVENGLIAFLVGLVRTITGLITGSWRGLVNLFTAVTGIAVGTARTAQQAVEVTQERRQEIMAQRAAEAQLKPTITRDPLLVQNRALSAFAVLLLLVLLTVVVLQTTENDNPDPFVGSSGGGIWPESRGTDPPTVLFPTTIPTPTPVPDPLRVGGSLVYSLRENGQEDLWTISVGESQPLRLTNSPADERDPAWSPDGTRIAFSSNREGNWELYIMRLDTGEITRLTYTVGFEGAPSWSPDGAWLAYEGYYPDSPDLDIYFISTDPARAAAEGAGRITYAPGPDTEPAWSPGGREIAFTSWRSSGNQDIFIVNLDAGSGDAGAINLTGTPNQNENFAGWSQDGTRLAYSAIVDGIEGVYVKPAQQATASPILVGRGKMPTWAPNGGSLVYTLDLKSGRGSQLIAGVPGNFGAATDAIQLDYRASDPDWTDALLPAHFIQSGGVPANPDIASPLYQEDERLRATGLYGIAPLNNIIAPQAFLSDRVNDSFEALRRRVLEKTGVDFLGTLEDAIWLQGRPPEPGEPRENWHYTGRAIAFDRNLVYAGSPAPIEIMREDIEINTYWRVYMRVVEQAQDGRLGEPLRDLPWDFAARSSGDVDDYERGGTLKDSVPAGYYVDLTQLAADYGWQRAPAQRTWQYNFGAIQFWELHKTDNLSWREAMLELYTPEELDVFLTNATPIPAPPPLPTDSPTPDVYRSPTPIPPDTVQ